ncbi:MAG: hypothetical protein WC451_05960 [Patescibacteria group bacterium]|jgi:hypothetical protein
MKRSVILRSVYIIAAIAIILIAFYFLYSNFIQADTLDEQIINEAMIDLGSSGTKKVRLLISGREGTIKVYRSLYSNCEYRLTGFEKDLRVIGVISVGEKKMIEVGGFVGVHAENKQFFILDDRYCPKPVVFEKNGTVEYNIYSDEPIFLVQDMNADGYVDVASDWRDYDQNPLKNGFRDIYYFNPESFSFQFVKRESIVHN